MATTKRKNPIPLPTMVVDATAATPLFRQLVEALAEAIRTGQFGPGTKLPSTRVLAAHLRVSRNTVHVAFEQLIAEGYLEGRQGAGTYVVQLLPEQLLQVEAEALDTSVVSTDERPVSRRTAKLMEIYPQAPWVSRGRSNAFRVTPALDEFPHQIWQRLLVRSWREGGSDLLDYGWGHGDLRQAIAEHLGAARGVRCTADNVIVVAGAQQGIDLAIRVLVEEGQMAWIEDPGYPTAHGALLSAGAVPVPVPVDKEGLDVAAGIERGADARLAYVTPSHQFPMGVTMSLRRRLQLLEWAKRSRAWIIEDDYSSEYRYVGRPLAALQGMDREERVIYLGTFSKILFPALRLAYLVVPRDLIQAFLVTRFFASRHPPRLEQAALASFIANGHFARHVRRMRALYASRQAALVEAAQGRLQGLLHVEPCAAGMHLLGWLPPGSDDAAVSRRIAASNIDATPLSAYAIAERPPPALILGYTGLSERAIRSSVKRLADALRE
jgi:GntR family transcriptional regulator/MocR family aminotransferase